jgi:hypothetical protein
MIRMDKIVSDWLYLRRSYNYTYTSKSIIVKWVSGSRETNHSFITKLREGSIVVADASDM